MKKRILKTAFRMSRNALFGLLVCCLFAHLGMAEDSSAQSIEDVFVEISAENNSVENILDDIENTTSFSFLYGKYRIDAMPHRISFSAKKRSVADILRIVSRETGLLFRQINSTITVKTADILPIQTKEQVQEKIEGTVSDAQSGETLPGVNILVKGTNIGISTDPNGNFELTVPSLEDTLVVSFVGYQTQEVPVAGQTEINIELSPKAIMGEEMVVVGYGTQEKENLTGSIKQVGGAELQEQPSILPSAALMGKAAGVTVIQNSGRPGANAGTIRIRGIGTLGQSSTNPLVLIDGVPGSLNDVSSSDIKNISIQKDAASAAIYGSRAANGVILVTTKRGEQGSIQVDYRSQYGINKTTRHPEFVDAGTFMRLENEGAMNLGQEQIWSDEFIQEWEENHETDPDNYPNTDWVNELFSGSGFQQTQNLSVTGGSERINFMGSLNYDQEKGTIPNFQFDRYSMRLNTDIKASDQLNFDLDLNTIRHDTQRPSYTMSTLTRQAYRIPPIYAGRYEDGSYGVGWNGTNPIAYAESGGTRLDESYRINGRIKMIYQPLDDLEFNLLYAPSFSSNFFKRMEKQYQVFNPNTGELLHTVPSQSNLLEGYARNFENNLNFTVSYQKDLADHQFGTLAGYEIHDYQREAFDAYRDEFFLQDYEVLDAASSANQQNSGNSSSYGLQSFFGRFNYNYKSKYLLEANLRYDGSSRFAEEVRWGVFPSFSAGWNISEESFLQSIDFLSEFKFRASWGRLGNQEIGDNFPYVSMVDIGQEFMFGGEPQAGAVQLRLSNPNLTWEETTSYNLGLDLSFFDNQLTFTTDWFKRTTDDILLRLPIPTIIGMTAPYQNAGIVKNTGWEIEAGYNGYIGRDFSFGVSLNLADVKNEVIDLKDTGPFFGTNTITQEGHPINSIYGYISDGFFQSQQEIDNHASQSGQVAPGDIRYRDLNEDGIINADDRTIIGDPFPRLNYGLNINFSYKNFDVSALFQGVGKRDVLLRNEAVWAFYNAGKITKWQAEDYWSPNNPDASYPRLTQAGKNHNNFRASDKWIYDASYLRLRNVHVGYTLPQFLIGNLSIRSARIFLTGQNLFTVFDNMPPGIDPNVENNETGSFFPINNSFFGGIEIKF